MASRRVVSRLQGHVKPVLSLDSTEAHRRVLNLYRAWYRNIPVILNRFNLPIDEQMAKNKLREMFYRYRNVTDIRVIDILVIKGNMELTETVKGWKQECHVMAYFKDTHNPKPKDFISKFLSGHDAE
ncbi:NADH dehydrogenase [ubiquinone] 1 alpha subcomplex subunit 6-like protein [Dinothrombium tinctorium]|uniref:NADH dehydrogenase [ubiquinone] 1 alpha subcomplex subunit 6 n=1 Tax=Dinothrombium tinctorium TaxID=1965070 RepID=A0A3S4QND8_9ACAR|nr:NADH dehydrogenase [ubiquinone] 1 alpha subcomplex subunit 6-like protein [Dinothrombium tinctorium]RWS05707.1 NADH dehydrogenase [ubiquinone] 1 alpha subcomplex subunit 6-like protein [Dinothrombium tinctorium]RWS06512.1 NADH dehydrogenase [ubiquinone] 1 alpha subcomplex subunit 6-like protein [Dinothrombium tinctorium]RWS07518.1 NADH dehydrogenase [ubiquinone] 1 alpha subcomplex subunit 6-like protein [Dinothrombium tinctorium]